jgi:hypothetical protein
LCYDVQWLCYDVQWLSWPKNISNQKACYRLPSKDAFFFYFTRSLIFLFAWSILITI